jgi:ankyrin repeat protein
MEARNKNGDTAWHAALRAGHRDVADFLRSKMPKPKTTQTETTQPETIEPETAKPEMAETETEAPAIAMTEN